MRNKWARMVLALMPRAIMLLAIMLVACLQSATAQSHTYQSLLADVPFRFSVGNHVFPSGRYQFVFVGTGLLAMLDSRDRVLTTIMTRPLQEPSEVAGKLIFHRNRKYLQLAEIWQEHRAPRLKILGEEVAQPQYR